MDLEKRGNGVGGSSTNCPTIDHVRGDRPFSKGDAEIGLLIFSLRHNYYRKIINPPFFPYFNFMRFLLYSTSKGESYLNNYL